MNRYDSKGNLTTGVPYSALTMGFAWEGQTIYNPLRTPDDSADCDPTFYGFELWQTGGGCEAHGLALPSGEHFLLTTEDGYPIDINEPDDIASACLGRYDVEGEQLCEVVDFDELPRNGSARP